MPLSREMAETGVAITEVVILLQLCAGKVCCSLPGPLAKVTARGKSSVHGQDPVLLPGACCVSDALGDCIFQLLSRPLKRSPSSGWGSGRRDWETSPGCCYLQGLHWVCQAILRPLGYEEIWLSASLRQLASEWTTYLSCEWIKKKKKSWREIIICKLFFQSHHYIFLNSKNFKKYSELSEVIHTTPNLSILLKNITSMATLVIWIDH